MISEVDEEMTGTIDFGEFLKLIEKQKERAAKFDDEADMGESPKMTGCAVRPCPLPLSCPSLSTAASPLALPLSPLSPAVDAFVACGGNPDRTGHVARDTLVRIVKTDFGLTVDIEELIDGVDADGTGELSYEGFRDLLTQSSRG